MRGEPYFEPDSEMQAKILKAMNVYLGRQTYAQADETSEALPDHVLCGKTCGQESKPTNAFSDVVTAARVLAGLMAEGWGGPSAAVDSDNARFMLDQPDFFVKTLAMARSAVVDDSYAAFSVLHQLALTAPLFFRKPLRSELRNCGLPVEKEALRAELAKRREAIMADSAIVHSAERKEAARQKIPPDDRRLTGPFPG